MKSVPFFLSTFFNFIKTTTALAFSLIFIILLWNNNWAWEEKDWHGLIALLILYAVIYDDIKNYKKYIQSLPPTKSIDMSKKHSLDN